MAQEMNEPAMNIIEQSQVAPPQGSLPSTIIPLTFLDIPWLLSRHARRIFFYDFPFPTTHFLQTALPILKHSLSHTLQHFFPFASNLILPPHPHVPYIRYLEGDSLSFTVAESSPADFTLLTSDSPRDSYDWQPLAPVLPSQRTSHDGTCEFPLMAIQVTMIPNSGFSICVIFDHVAGDGRTLHHFMKFWASVCKAKGDLDFPCSMPLPLYDRNIVKDPKGLMHVYMQDLRNSALLTKQFRGVLRGVYTDKVRATFIFSSEQAQKLKKWVSLKCNGSRTLHISTFVVTCSLIWVCMLRSEQKEKEGNNEPCNIGFSADCHNHPQFSLPSNYFGNCLIPLITRLKRGELVEQNGIVAAANAIEKKIRDFKSDALRWAETTMSDIRGLRKSGQSLVVIVGSPKLTAYNTDFGWGKPVKSEVVNLDSVGTVSLSDCRDQEGGIQVGMVLERIRMNNFTSILEEHLSHVAVLD
ncbi:hypothetical protein AAZX31_13G285200 [Glycine max]|uniref:Anthocyanin acyltransferase n=1 Tax=Glycine max TaxID=3847 RepID=A0A0R0GWF1_SOYBN|nr:coumaroyl-CoA:anthocyanidin 3-O-glucoside-6''-O-coumaroyltransferase 2 [Glycine max]KAG4972052.1 hypothetical protein JHK85_038473 [Glycine max]KAG4978441.1 hypothetical protein JHK86_037915 [Glycine max]KAG5131733.1 hypothetical protein JHK84_038130 [Glycine max]KAH1104118.1 hypothetical protein GYH30_037844 [Glycine max]KAH1218712.1 Coumaroyl-CoA:anthocyanidin 3-O-glucoside-6''-O-coumaroyltransferase 2 [Glycine max]